MSKASKEDSAAFRSPLGWAYRKHAFNEDIKSLLGKYITYGKISSHSFRAGLASLMAQAGYKDETIMAVGRWSSDAFKATNKNTDDDEFLFEFKIWLLHPNIH